MKWNKQNGEDNKYNNGSKYKRVKSNEHFNFGKEKNKL